MRAAFPLRSRIRATSTSSSTSADFDKPLYDANDALFGMKQRDALHRRRAAVRRAGVDQAQRASQAELRVRSLDDALQSHRRILDRDLGRAAVRRRLLGEARPGDSASPIESRTSSWRSTRTNLEQVHHAHRLQPTRLGERLGQSTQLWRGVSALLFGRDEGFYYRASGAELALDEPARHAARLALVRRAAAHGGVAHRLLVRRRLRSRTSSRRPAVVRRRPCTGPARTGSIRTDFARSATCASRRRPVIRRTAAPLSTSRSRPDCRSDLAAALTLAGGTSVGQLPPQRRWFLGGTQTIRGETPDTTRAATRSGCRASRPGATSRRIA